MDIFAVPPTPLFNRTFRTLSLSDVSSQLDLDYTFSVRIFHRWCCVLYRLLHLQASCVHLPLFGDDNFDHVRRWFPYFVITISSLITSKRSVRRHFKIMKISFSSAKYFPGFSIHLPFFPDSVFTPGSVFISCSMMIFLPLLLPPYSSLSIYYSFTSSAPFSSPFV